MCLQIGSEVSVIDGLVKGVVTHIVDDQVTLKDQDGMVYVYQIKELVKVDKRQDELLKYSNMDRAFLNQKKKLVKAKKTAFKTVKKEVVLEVDLHAEKLMKSTNGLDNYDILNIQIETAKRKLEFAIQKRIFKIIFIHGVGEGVLKQELHYLLGRYPVKFSEASYKHYGAGATEVYIKQNY